MIEPIKLNFVIGHYWEGENSVATYMINSSEVHYGTMKEAENCLSYVKKQSPDEDWRIFQLVQVLK